MDFGATGTFSREDLQGLPMKNRLETMKVILTEIYHGQIKPIAVAGGTSYKFTNFKHRGQSGVPYCYSVPYTPTVDDFVEGFQSMFPGCRVEYSETWEETNPGIREQKRFIIIDWSTPVSGLVTSVAMRM